MEPVKPNASKDAAQSTTPQGANTPSVPADPGGIENPNRAADQAFAAATAQKTKSTPQAAGMPRIGGKRRKKRLDPVYIALGTAVFLFFVSTVFFAVAYLREAVPQGMEPAAESPIERENRELYDTITDLERTISDMRAEQDKLTEELALFREATDVDGDFVTEMTTRLATLREKEAAYAAELTACREKIAVLDGMNREDFSTKTAHIKRLMELLLKEAPLLPPKEEETEAGEAVLTETTEGTEAEDPQERYPTLAVYYEDLTTGYSFAYNEDEVMYAASLIKAPYVYAVIREIDDFEKNRHDFADDGTPLYDEEGVPLFEGEHPHYDENGKLIYREGEQKYDLDEIWTYDPDTMYEEGSGKIQYEAKGFTLTIRELFEYTLLYSDNVAFRQLRERFGMDSFYAMVGRLGIRGTKSGFMQLCAADCAAVLRDLYAYIETEEPWAIFLRDTMTRSMHTVMIQAAVSPTPCAHKYGWDTASYHDMAIVFDTHPYVMVVMTDLDMGGETVNAYIRSLVKECAAIHASTYQNPLHTETETAES